MITLFYLIALNLGIASGDGGASNDPIPDQSQIIPTVPAPTGGACGFDDG